MAVIIEEVFSSEEAPSVPAPMAGAATGGPATEAWVKNRSKIGAEFVGAVVSCGLTVASGIGIAGALAATPTTGGLSAMALTVLWTGFGTGAIQCANGVVRVGAALADPSLALLNGWDTNSWYSIGILVVDALGVASGVSSLPSGVRRLWDAFSRLRSFRAANLSFDGLRRMGRLERLRTVSKVLKDATQGGEGVVEIVEAAKQAKITVRTMQSATRLSQKDAATLIRIIKDETVRQLHAAFTDILATNTSLILSGTPARLTGSGSGSINWVINLIDAGQPAQ